MSAYLTRLKVAVLMSSAGKPGLSVSATTPWKNGPSRWVKSSS